MPLRSGPGFSQILGLLEAADRRLLRVRCLQRQAWIVVIHLQRPARKRSQ